MSDQQIVEQKKPMTLKEYVFADETKKKFESLLKERSSVFLTSLVQIANSNEQLKIADPISIINSALIAATLNLPLNNSIGFAYIVPYKNKDKIEAQFQLSYKGYKQLALRTGLFLYLNASDVREGEIVKYDRLSGAITFNWIEDFDEREKRKVVGYVSYFELLNGFSQSFYMTYQQVHAHAKKYSQSFKSSNDWVVKNSRWTLDFEGMALKTVTKLNLSKNAPLSVELQTAIQADQAVIKEAEDGEFEYVDNQPEALNQKSAEDHENERFEGLIRIAKTQKDIDNLKKNVPDALLDTLLLKEQEIQNKAK